MKEQIEEARSILSHRSMIELQLSFKREGMAYPADAPGIIITYIDNSCQTKTFIPYELKVSM